MYHPIVSHHEFNPFPNKPWFLRVCTSSPLKTLWEKEKLLVTSNFSFSYSALYHCREHSAFFIKYKLSSANPFSLEESKIRLLVKIPNSWGVYVARNSTRCGVYILPNIFSFLIMRHTCNNYIEFMEC